MLLPLEVLGLYPAHDGTMGGMLDSRAAVKMPRDVVFVESLPYTATHRVAKFRLREDLSLRARAVDLQPAAP